MSLTNLYQINGQPLLAPDMGVELTFTDLDSADSGRDEAGFMHRTVVRHKVPSWRFVYSSLTEAEYAYMLRILPSAGSFTFTHPAEGDSGHLQQTTAYLSQYGIVYQNARTKTYKNLKFSIIAC